MALVALVPVGLASSEADRMSRPGSRKLAVNHIRVGELGHGRSAVGRTGCHGQQQTVKVQAAKRQMRVAEDQQTIG